MAITTEEDTGFFEPTLTQRFQYAVKFLTKRGTLTESSRVKTTYKVLTAKRFRYTRTVETN